MHPAARAPCCAGPCAQFPTQDATLTGMTSRNQGLDDRLHGEETIVALLAPLTEGDPGAFGLKDDCALLTPEPGTELVLKTDPVAEGVHFLAGDTPEDIAWKALAVNVSDLAAKGATPIAYLMALSFPEAPSRRWLAAFAAGLRDAQTRFGCRLLGGDTDRRPGPLTISITAIGSVPQGQMVRRTSAQAGCTLLVSGTIGDATLGLALAKEPGLAAAWGLTLAESEYLVRRYRRPEPRLALAPVLRRYAAASMDLSDGLVKDLERMLRGSGLGGRLRAGDVPFSEPARKVLAREPARLAQVITGGDDYEVLAAAPGPRARCEELRAAAAKAGVALSDVGMAGPSAWPEHGSGLLIEGPDRRPLTVDRTGWDHFGPAGD
jgi:thiamine-monophosphate kinase